MGVSMRDLGIDQLPPDQRIALALEIWESLGDERPKGLSAEQRAELVKRDSEMDVNPELARTWKQIRANIEGRP